jgi:hypothetical protein
LLAIAPIRCRSLAGWPTGAAVSVFGVYSGISRRALLRGLVGVAGLAGIGSVAGCDLFGGSTPDEAELSPELAALLAQTVTLGDAYDGAITRVPTLAAQLTGPRDAHRAHAEALAQALAQPTPSPGTTDGGTDPAGVLAELIDAETRGLEDARTACLSAPNRLAPLIGSIAAARACHLEVLR